MDPRVHTCISRQESLGRIRIDRGIHDWEGVRNMSIHNALSFILYSITMPSLSSALSTKIQSHSMFTIRAWLDVHDRSGTSQQRPNHHSSSRARGHADCDNRPRRRRTSARSRPSLACPASPLGSRRPVGGDERLCLARRPRGLLRRPLWRFL